MSNSYDHDRTTLPNICFSRGQGHRAHERQKRAALDVGYKLCWAD